MIQSKPVLGSDGSGLIAGSIAKGKLDLSNVLGKDAFLRLLITELQHQNPLEPMNNREFVTQMAQFSALEQMQNLNKAFESMALLELASQASNLLGKNIRTMDESGNPLEGKVTSVKLSSGIPIVVLDGEREIPLVNVHEIVM